MDSYYVELARVALNKATESLNNAQEYLARAKPNNGTSEKLADSKAIMRNESEKIERITASVVAMNKRFGRYLVDGQAWPTK